MTNYVLKRSHRNIIVKEVATDNNIYVGRSKKDAGEILNRLNRGYGFDGWTPNFILNNKVA